MDSLPNQNQVAQPEINYKGLVLEQCQKQRLPAPGVVGFCLIDFSEFKVRPQGSGFISEVEMNGKHYVGTVQTTKKGLLA